MGSRKISNSAPKAPRLRLAPVRSRGSAELDGQVIRVTRDRAVEVPPFERWDEFFRKFSRDWKQGEHVTMIGTTGSGKTTLGRQLLSLRDYVIVLATKQRDDSLYKPLEKLGYVTVSSVDQISQETPRVIFRPGLHSPDKAGMQAQADAFRDLLVTVYIDGGWCLYCDEVRYLTDNLGLKTEMETLWLQGRSLGVTIAAGTQRPVSIPLLAFDQAVHMFDWRNSDKESVRRMSEFAGGQQETVAKTIPLLPEHECLYINVRTDRLVRTKVIL